MRGTLLNTATVTAGALLGWKTGQFVPVEAKTIALHGLGLVTACYAVKMFLGTKSPLVVGAAVALGGVLGMAIGLHHGIAALADWSQMKLGGQGKFAEGIVVSFVLFCVGPMTLLGCIQDALERKIDILGMKSTLDGIAAFFLAAATGPGLLVTAVMLFLFQGAITLAAKPLRPIVEHDGALAEMTAAGGAVLLATGLGLLELADFHTANYLPAIFLAPGIVLISERFRKREVAS